MTNAPAHLTGSAARAAATDRLPVAQITFYNRLIVLQRWLESGETVEHPVSPAGLVAALGEKVTLHTGLLHPNTLHIRQSGDTKTIIAYVPPKQEGLWLDGEADALHIPLPGFVIKREWDGSTSPKYSIWAVKERPSTLDAMLYVAPLPNVGSRGSCWGTVEHPAPEVMHSTNSLEADWSAFIGSRFGNHNRRVKSKMFDEDIIAMWRHLHNRKAKTYPLDDLIEYTTLSEVLS